MQIVAFDGAWPNLMGTFKIPGVNHKTRAAYLTACSLFDALELQQKEEDAFAAESLFVSGGDDASADEDEHDEQDGREVGSVSAAETRT